MATLSLTQDAADAIRQLTETPAAEGVRISVAPPSAERPGPGLQIELATAPQANDAVLEAEGARLFLEPGAAGVLDDKVLDADVEGGQIRFAILEQPEGEPPPGEAPPGEEPA